MWEKQGCCIWKNAGNWSSHDYWLKYPKDEPENPEDITCYYDWRKENHTVYQIDFHKNGVTLENTGALHQDPPEGSGQYTDTDLWTDFPVPVYYDVIVYPHTYEPSGYAFFEYCDAYSPHLCQQPRGSPYRLRGAVRLRRKLKLQTKKLPPWLTALGEVFYQNRGSSGSGGNSQYCVRSATTAERNTGCPALKSTVSRVG